MSSKERYITTKTIGAPINQSQYTFVPKEEGEMDFELLVSSRDKSKNYSRFDIFVLLQFAQGTSIGFDVLIRTLFYELSQLFTPSELISRLIETSSQLTYQENSVDKTKPVGMLSVLKDSSASFSNYANLLFLLMNTENLDSKQMDEIAKKEIILFLENESKSATMTTAETIKKRNIAVESSPSMMSREQWDTMYSDISPVLKTLRMVYSEESNLAKSSDCIQKIFCENLSFFSETLVPAQHIDCMPISIERRVEIVENLATESVNKIIIRWNRET